MLRHFESPGRPDLCEHQKTWRALQNWKKRNIHFLVICFSRQKLTHHFVVIPFHLNFAIHEVMPQLGNRLKIVPWTWLMKHFIQVFSLRTGLVLQGLVNLLQLVRVCWGAQNLPRWSLSLVESMVRSWNDCWAPKIGAWPILGSKSVVSFAYFGTLYRREH